MKHLVVRAGLFIATLIAGIAPVSIRHVRADSGQTEFTCGPNALTYLSIPIQVNLGVQVRCVIVDMKAPASASFSAPRMVWYGEGWDGNPSATNRHLGVAFATTPKGDLTGYAADLSGKGAARQEDFLGNINVHVVHGSWPAPTVLDVTADCGCFHDRWTLVQSVPYSSLGRPTACAAKSGPSYYAQYAVSYTGHTGSGLRCAATLTGSAIVGWFGNGTMDGVKYTEIGYRTPHGYAVTDLCGGTFGTRCDSFSDASVKVTQATAKKGTGKVKNLQSQSAITVKFSGSSGSWTEHWVKK